MPSNSKSSLFCVFSLFILFACFSQTATAAVFTVTNADESGAGSLRQAIADADASPSDDEIVFDPAFFNTPRTINLLSELNVAGAGNLTIHGPGVDFLEIINPQTMITSPPRYSFNVSNGQLTLKTIKVRGIIISMSGRAIIERTRFINLGVINNGITTINDSVISNCGSRFDGGGMSNSGTMTVNRSTIANNQARNGGGIFTTNGNSGTSPSYLFINDSVIGGNQVVASGAPAPSGRGGAIYQQGGNITINRSIVRNNSATTVGGIAGNSGTINVYNSTIVGNSGGGSSGGLIYGAGIDCPGTVSGRMINSTVVGNGGGSDVSDTSAIFQVGNSIIGVYWGSFGSLGHNIIGNASGIYSTSGSTTGNQLNVNPQLVSLTNNGGATETLAPLPTSPAINAGNNALGADAAGNRFSTDQRGGCYRRISGGSVDIGAYEIQGSTAKSCSANFDFEGDGKSDISVFRPSTGSWYVSRSSNNSFSATLFGQNGDLIAPADFDGDGKTDVSVFRNGFFYRINSSTNQFVGLQFGSAGDIPTPGDFDGDGRADVSVYRPSNGTWYRINSSDNRFVEQRWGTGVDLPLLGDFDGDSRTDLTVFRPSAGAWYALLSSSNSFYGVSFGTNGDIPTPADYDADGKTDISVFRPSVGTWYRMNSSNNQFVAQQWGSSEDKPVAADYDADGRADIAVFRSSLGTWYLLRFTQGFAAQQWGTNGDIPIPAAFPQ